MPTTLPVHSRESSFVTAAGHAGNVAEADAVDAVLQ